MINIPQTVKNIGEQGLLKIVQRFSPPSIVGDDGAVVSVSPGYSLVVTTDVLVDGVHFSDGTTSAFDAGWRGVAANLSDLAAMGASPLGITVGLSLREDLTIQWVENLYQGMESCLQQYYTNILGGDITRSSVNTIAITAFGEVFPSRIIERSQAKVGDLLVMTGYHGRSRGGLELLLNPKIGNNLTLDEKNICIKAHQRPIPRLDVLDYLWNLEDCNHIAGMDSSDGLADAVIQICQASGVGGEIDLKYLPLAPELLKLVGKKQGLEWTLYGGEDFELVLSLPEKQARILVERLEKPAAIIGKITDSHQVKLIDSNNPQFSKNLTLDKGFQHFQKN